MKDNLPKIDDINLLAGAKSEYKDNSFRNSAPEIIEIFDNCIANQIEEMPFSDSLKFLVRDKQIIPENLLIPILKNNISAIVTHFTESPSYAEAGKRSELIVIIAEELNEAQWKNILTAFFDNNQLCDSWDCRSNFRKLFEKYLKLNNKSVQPVRLPFRKKLNKLNGSIINNFKQLIDSHLTPEQKNKLNNEL